MAQPAAVADPVEEHYDPDHLIFEDLFGFSGTTETGDKGDRGLGTENDFRIGKRDGRYFTTGAKLFFVYTFADDWFVATSVFGDLHRIRGVSVQPVDLNRKQFDGASVEIGHRIIRRSASNPFAVTLSFEPRWGRIDGGSGLRATSGTGEMKLLVDAVVIPGKLFWAMSANFAPNQQRDLAIPSKWVKSTGASLSTAASLGIGGRATLGVELRYQTQFNTIGLRQMTGRAFLTGPTGVLRITEDVSLNGVFLSQIAGHAKGAVRARLDLDNFERRTFRVALQTGF